MKLAIFLPMVDGAFEEEAVFVMACLAWGIFGFFWYRFGVRIFEGSMLGERVSWRYARTAK